MKTRKRKRSAKTAPAARVPVVDAVAAERSVEAATDNLPEVALTNEMSPAAVEALVAEPVAAEPAVEAAVETIEAAAEAVAAESEPAAEAVAETVAACADPTAEVVDPNAETVVADPAELAVAEPAQAADPVVVLAANCSVKDAAALKTSLCAVANESTDVTLDVSAVERVDTATMQLLCAFVRDRSGRNQSVTWRGESQALQDAVRLLGVGELLGLESKGVAA